eukprot:14588977-Heterocapsa_arctica.AAC.1
MELIPQGGGAGDGDVIGEPPPPPPPVPDGEQVEQAVRRRRVKKDDAMSLEHMPNHKPSNPNCDACARGKMRDCRKFRGAFAASGKLKKYLEHVTCDHIVSHTIQALTGAINAFVLKDIKSSLKEFCPM